MALIPTRDEFGHGSACGLQSVDDLADIGLGQFVIGKVERGFDISRCRQELIVDLVEARAERPFELLERRRCCAVRFRAHQIEYGLGLKKIQPPVHERALRELARLSKPGAGFNHSSQDAPRNDVAAVPLNLHDIFSRVTAWRAHDEQQNVVNDAAVNICNMPMDNDLRWPR